MTANLCCEPTGRHLVQQGYDVTFHSDAIGAESLAAYEGSVHLNYPLIANAVLEVDEFLAALTGGDDGPAARAGDTVYGSDRGKIGTIEDVSEASDGTAGYLLVKRGAVLDRDIYIPLDAVTKRAGDRVFINVPRLIVGKMPWGELPSAADVRDKLGPPAAEVGWSYRSRSPTAVER